MPKGNESTTKFKADISQLKAAMQEAARQVRLANSEFKAATAGMDDWSKSADGLSAKTKQLDNVLKAQNSQLKSLEQQYKLTAEEQGENSKGAQELLIKINNQKAAIGKTEAQLKKYADKLGDMDKEADQAGDSASDLANDIEDVNDSARNSSDGFTVMKGALSNLVADGIRVAIQACKDLAKETFQAGANFESAMSQVEAVSGASVDELEALTDKAKEMGAKTKFSASESAEAFNYMAMAGWKTEDMINGIEGVMNLAAASGEDLATSSDIVTDALTAMGYGAKDAGRLADVMAAASSNANTNVSMMGETFKYAAAVGGSYGYTMEDIAIATGLMANAGIKGTQSGTALRSIMTRLATDAGASSKTLGALGTLTKELGVAFYDAKGDMRPFGDVINDTRKAWKGLTKEEAANYGKKIAGQEALSGWLSLMNASEKDVKKLTDAVNESTGAAQEMSDTMNDNVNGDITLLKSQIEGKMIAIFERASKQIRGGVKQISTALEQVDWDKVGDKVGKFATKSLNFFTYLVTNGDKVVSVLKGVGTVLLTIFAVNKVATFVSSIGTLITTFKNVKVAIDAAKTSQLALNAAQLASPVGLAVAAVGALAAGMIYAQKQFEKQIETEYGLNEAQKETIANANAMAEAYEQMDSARNETNSNISSEFGYLEELKEEYNNLITSNGKVKKGYEDRAEFILTQLAESMGVERDEIDKLIEKNGKLGNSIDELMVKKQAEALLNANESSYNEAIQKRDEALKTYQASLKTAEEAEKKYTDAKKKGNDALDEYYRLLKDSPSTASDYYWANRKAIEGEKEAKQSRDDANKSLKEAEKAYIGYNTTISNYEGVSAASISGDAKKIKTEMLKLQNNFIDSKNGTKEALEQQVKDTQTKYDELKKAIEDKTPGVTEAQVKQAKKMATMAKKELDKAYPEAKKAGEKTGEGYAEGVKSKNGDAKKAGQSEAKATTEGAKNGAAKMNAAGQYTTIQYVDGVNSKKSEAKEAGKNLGKNANEGADSYKDDAETSGGYFGQGFINGISSLFKSVKEKAKDLAKKAWEGLKEGQKEGSPSKLTYQSGVFFTQGYINGIASQQSNLVKAVKSLASSAIKELTKVSDFDFTGAYQNVSSTFADNFSEKVEYMTNKMAYQNESKLASFDKTISKLEKERDKKISTAEKNSTKRQTALEKERDKKVAAIQKQYDNTKDKAKKKQLKNEIDSIKKSYTKKINAEKSALKKQQTSIKNSYTKQINEQKKQKEAYQKASSQMLSEFSSAMSEYQTKAQALIDDVIGGITNTYQAQYDALISKQDTLIDKMKSAGDLFEVSGAGVMTINDLKEQTKQIEEYASKLQTIKGKVSSDLFDQIASYDMEQGSAFMDQLLSMSAADLKAYSDAYDKKISIAETLGANIYKKDIDKVSKDYKDAINAALKDLPKQLEDLGVQSMKGFLQGLTKNTDYMDKYVKTYVKGMVNQFKKQLGIHSPSRVMAGIGEYTGQGFAKGLKDSVDYVKKSASSLMDATSTSLGEVKSALGSASFGGTGVGGTSVVNNYNLVQNNTSPKSLSALETYQARRQQIALVKALT